MKPLNISHLHGLSSLADPPATAVAAPAALLTTDSGATARLLTEEHAQRLEVRDEHQQLLFSYDAATGEGTLRMPSGNLRLEAPHGSIELVAGQAVRCRSGEEVRLEVGPEGAARGENSILSLAPRSAKLAAQSWRLVGRRAELLIAEASYQGERLVGTVADVRFITQRVEQLAVDLVVRAKRVFSRVDEHQRVEAGRMSTVVAGGYCVKSGYTSIEADDDVKINGERIHLG